MKLRLVALLFCAGALPAPHAFGEALFGSCADVLRGTVCELDGSGPLTVWLDEKADTWTFDGDDLENIEAREIDGGVRYVITPPAATGTLVAKGADDATLWTIDLVLNVRSREFEKAQRAFAEQRYNDALKYVDPILATADLDTRTLALRMKARIALRQGDTQSSMALLTAAGNAARRAGRDQTALLCGVALEYALRKSGRDLEDSRSVLEAVRPDRGASAMQHYQWHSHRAHVARFGGNVRAELRHFRRASEVAKRMGWAPRRLRADTWLALLEHRLGHPQRALNILGFWRENLPLTISGYDHAMFLNNVVWSQLLVLEARESVTPSPGTLSEAITLADQHAPPFEQVNARLNMALLRWYEEDFDNAAAWLDQARARAGSPSLEHRHWALDIEARIAASRGQVERALELYEAMELSARAASLPEANWRARTRRAWVLAGAGRQQDAIEAFESAERALDETVLRVPLSGGRESLIASRRFAMREHLALLMELDRPDDALALVQREQRRAMQFAHVSARVDALTPSERQKWDAVQARYRRVRMELSEKLAEGWMLAADDLTLLTRQAQIEEARLRRLLDEGVAVLAGRPYSLQEPALDDRPTLAIWRAASSWAILTRKNAQTRLIEAKCDSSDQDTLTRCLLGAATPMLREIEQIDLIIDHDLAALDWHAMELDDEPLLAHGTVRYRAGLHATNSAYPSPGLALLVADPTGNLAAARDEIGDVQSRLRRGGGWRHTLFKGVDAQATSVRTALDQASLFHYAGHATFGENSGWDSALLLAENTKLSVGDVLTLQSAPQVVVLSGCETALNAGVQTPAMGLANAFLSVGAEAVIATSRSVDDRSARIVMSEFYDRWLQGNTIDHALRTAQLHVRKKHPELDWSAFRLMTP